VRVAVEEGAGDDALLGARVRLLEGFIGRARIADAAQFALQWLGELVGIRPSLCLVRPLGEQSLFVVGSYGLSGGAVDSFSVSP